LSYQRLNIVWQLNRLDQLKMDLVRKNKPKMHSKTNFVPIGLCLYGLFVPSGLHTPFTHFPKITPSRSLTVINF